MREASISQCYESTIPKVKMPQKLKLLGEDTRIIFLTPPLRQESIGLELWTMHKTHLPCAETQPFL